QEADLLGQQLARGYQDVTLERLHELEETTRVAAERVAETRATRETTTGALGIVRDVVRCRSHAHALVSESANLGTECEDLERQIRAGDTTLSDLDVAIATVDAELADTAYDDSRHLLLGRLEPHAVRREQIVERLSTLDQDTVVHAAALKAAQEEHASRQKDLLSAQSVLAT